MGPFDPGIVEQNLQDSIVKHPRLLEGRLSWTIHARGPLLPAWGSRERERALRLYWRHDYNTLFRGAIAGLIKRVQSTPYTVKAPRQDGDRWQKILMNADFGDWDRFLSKLLVDYSRQDVGAFVELIAPGDPRHAPSGPVSGLAILDSVRCYPTGDPEYPVIYYDIKGTMHILHHARVVQFVDTPDSDENTPGYGDCALSRAIAPVNRQILMGRYVETSLDDEPPPGIASFSNIGEEQVQAAIETMQAERNTDQRGEWGRLLRLYSLRQENAASVEITSFSKPPESFDFEKYTNLDAREMAVAIGIDVQDIWGELTGGGLGQGQQSEILAQKSRGKSFGRILKGLERLVNRAFPVDVEMAWEYVDPQEDLEQATILQTTAGAIQILSGVLSPDEARTLLANTVPAVHDVLVDETGNVRKLGDADPKGAAEEIRNDVPSETPALAVGPAVAKPGPPEHPGLPSGVAALEAQLGRKGVLEPAGPANPPLQKTAKDFAGTSAAFVAEFTRIVNGAAGATPAVTRSILRDALWNAGWSAYQDGLRDGGVDPSQADAEELAMRRRTVAEWNASQTGYIMAFIEDVLSTTMSPEKVAYRADLWVNKSLRAIYYAGLVDAESELVFPWLLGPSKKHCNTCLANAGQQHTMKDWVGAGMFPGSSALECEGYQCKCRFGDGIKGKSIGRLPGARPSLGERLSSWIRGLVRK